MSSTWWYHVMWDFSHWSRDTENLSQARANDKKVFNKTDINQIQIHLYVFIENSSSSWKKTKKIDENILMIICYKYVSSTITSIFYNWETSCLKDHAAEFARKLNHVIWFSKMMRKIFWKKFSKILKCIYWNRFLKNYWISLHHFYELWSIRKCRRNYEQNSDIYFEILVNRLQD